MSNLTEEWGRLYFELNSEDRLVLRNLALTRLYQSRKAERQMTWVAAIGEPVIIGDRRAQARSRPELGRRLGDVALHGGNAMLYAACIPLSSFALQPVLNNLAQASNATHNVLLISGNLGFSIGVVAALWLTFILGARFHVRRMEKIATG